MELLIMINACKIASAQRVTAVIPCYPYARYCGHVPVGSWVLPPFLATMKPIGYSYIGYSDTVRNHLFTVTLI